MKQKNGEINGDGNAADVNGGAVVEPFKSVAGFANPGVIGEQKVGAEVGWDSGKSPCKKGSNGVSGSTDIFSNLDGLRLEQDFVKELGLARPLTTIPVKKPGKTAFVRVHPGENYRFQTAVIELKDDGETYIVAKQLWPFLVNEPAFVPKVFVTYMARPGDVLALWPIRLPGPDGRLDDYNQSALNIGITLATKSWVRVNANRYLGAYEATVAPAGISWGEPKWPDMPFEEILRLAFKDKLIETLDHPVLKRLRGET